MKLYYSKGACSLAVRILIHELGLKCEYEAVDLKTKKTETGADYLQINPKGAVPALALSANEVLTENAVIHQYLAEQNKAFNLLPAEGDFKRYRVLEWLNFVTTELHKGFGPLFNQQVPNEDKENIFIPLLKKKFDFVDHQLANKKYLLGENYTLPDGYLFVMIFWLSSFKIDVAAWPNLSRYFTELKNRKAVQQSLQEEKLN